MVLLKWWCGEIVVWFIVKKIVFFFEGELWGSLKGKSGGGEEGG